MDTIENLLARAHKVVIDQKVGSGAGGNMFYLPLDKLLDKAAARGESEQSSENSANSAPKEQDSVTVEARGRGER
jgi:membrane protease subunit HflK